MNTISDLKMKDEALKLALEALESCETGHISDGGNQWHDEKLVDKAITAIKQALAAPVQEPVAWVVAGKVTDWSKDFSAYRTKNYTRAVYTTPPAAQRQWVGLTDEEIKILWVQYRAALPRYLCFAKALLQRSKEKNSD